MDIKDFDFENMQTDEYYNFLREDLLKQFTSALVEKGLSFDVRKDNLILNLREVNIWKVYVRSKKSRDRENGFLSEEEISALLGGLT